LLKKFRALFIFDGKVDRSQEKDRGPNLLVKVSVNRFVSRRIETTRKEVKAGTQKLRKRALENLEEIFRVAARIAKGEIKHQRSDRKMVPTSLNQQRRCASVAAHVAQIMNSVASNFDEREIDVQLDELQRLVNETNANPKNGRSKRVLVSNVDGIPAMRI
jgi:hypothetical protein